MMPSFPVIEYVLQRLDGVVETGKDQWKAQCPAHEDRSPSLSIKLQGDRLMVHCFAGCTFEEIAAACRLKKSDFFADNDPQKIASFKKTHKKRAQLDVHENHLLIQLAGLGAIRRGEQLTREQLAEVTDSREKLLEIWRYAHVTRKVHS